MDFMDTPEFHFPTSADDPGAAGGTGLLDVLYTKGALKCVCSNRLITTCHLMLTFSYLNCFQSLLVNTLLIGGLVQSLPNGQKSKE